MYKFLLFLALACCSFAAPQPNITKKVTGKYGKIDRENGEYICLELFENQAFIMSIRTCDRDKDITGTYQHTNDAIYLNSEKKAAITITERSSTERTTDQHTLHFVGKDTPLLQQISVRINDEQNAKKLDGNFELKHPQNIEKIQVQLGELSANYTLKNPIQNQVIQLDFEHLDETTITNQRWALSRKKLIYTDPSGTKISLKKTRKCWFDYAFEGE